jgi:hypothetical protein
MKRTIKRILPVSAAVACLLAVMVKPGQASGPGEGGRRVRLNDEPAGPYLLRVVTSPTPPQIENLYVEVRVTDPATGKTVTDADVVVHAAPTEIDGSELRVEAVHDIAPIPMEYAAHLPVDKTGLWEITVGVDGQQGQGAASFLLTVSSPPRLSWLVAVGAPIGGLAALIVVFLWLQRHTAHEDLDAGSTPSND